ncbi:ABC transporter permease [Hoyosella sp. YIM 151337]|uniref:MlaE family ABC transporter permease n=1 Tax=Hoyosella sp. YIM 151337 TaxID=2992742 RepID=UPI0022369FF8|nr:ABC transporter permease [Hoyosella sp. YIM 151337]MCW4353387.1 ABC transporter permease [Hoyosella sp. YIM 151337]
MTITNDPETPKVQGTPDSDPAVTEAEVFAARFPKTARRGRRITAAVDAVGDHAVFYLKALAYGPRAVMHSRRETVRLIAEVGMGTGALAIIGGTVVIMGFLTMFAGGTIAVQGFSSLGNIGIEALTGFFSAFINVRIAGPVIAGVGLAATIGAGCTAELGAMRVSEEIDALETMAVPSLPYLVSTRVIAGMIVIIPLYSLAIMASFFGGRFVTVQLYGQSPGLYDHYFSTFLRPVDLMWSFVQVLVMAVVVMLIHSYYGYYASGGPVGVGVAVGKATRASLVAVVTVTLIISLAVYGSAPSLDLTG